jgi:prevent-host-death family protein
MTTLELWAMKKSAVGSRELKTRLGTYLRQVQNGRILVITDRGRPVAELRPMVAGRDGEQGLLDEFVALGLITRKSNRPFARIRRASFKGKGLSAAVIKDREDRF